MIRSNKCDCCKRELSNGDKVTAVVPDVEITTKVKERDSLHLKMSSRSIKTRAITIYCEKCFGVYNYLPETINDANDRD